MPRDFPCKVGCASHRASLVLIPSGFGVLPNPEPLAEKSYPESVAASLYVVTPNPAPGTDGRRFGQGFWLGIPRLEPSKTIVSKAKLDQNRNYRGPPHDSGCVLPKPRFHRQIAKPAWDPPRPSFPIQNSMKTCQSCTWHCKGLAEAILWSEITDN